MGTENCRSAFRAVATFQKGNRIPQMEAMGFWDETLVKWYDEGLPKNVSPYDYFDLDEFMDNSSGPKRRLTNCATQPSFWPLFEQEILEETEEHVVLRDTDGVVKRKSKSSESVPQFLRFPVRTRKDWEEIKWRLDPDVEERYFDRQEVARLYAGHKYVLGFGVCGGYGFPRSLFGTEDLSLLYYDDPALLHEIMEQWLYLYVGMADRICPLIDFDHVLIWEDMAYKTGPLTSPKLFREFVLPYTKQFINHMKTRHKIDLFMVDSDGNNLELLPLFMEAGINIYLPCEIPAGMEPLEVRRRFPSLALLGGIDKRCLGQGKSAIEEEIMRKVPALIESGGYFPSVDHNVPPNVSLENFQYYLSFLREVTAS